MKNKFRIRASDDPDARVFTFKVRPHPHFTRKGTSLLMKLSIDGLEALLGCTRSIVDPYGGTLKLEIPPNSAPGTRLRFKGYGVQLENKSPGDLLIDLEIRPLSPADRKTLHQAAKEAGLIDR